MDIRLSRELKLAGSLAGRKQLRLTRQVVGRVIQKGVDDTTDEVVVEQQGPTSPLVRAIGTMRSRRLIQVSQHVSPQRLGGLDRDRLEH